MGHLLSTLNPEAAEEADSGRLVPHHPEWPLLPRVGQMVSYHPRPGEFRRGREEFPAIVLHAEPERGTLDLLVVYDRDDWHGMEGVPRWPADGSTLGWTQAEPPRSDSARDPRFDDMLAKLDMLEGMIEALASRIFGKLEMPEGETLLGILDEHEDRVTTLETNCPKAEAIEKKLATLRQEINAKAKPKA